MRLNSVHRHLREQADGAARARSAREQASYEERVIAKQAPGYMTRVVDAVERRVAEVNARFGGTTTVTFLGKPSGGFHLSKLKFPVVIVDCDPHGTEGIHVRTIKSSGPDDVRKPLHWALPFVVDALGRLAVELGGREFSDPERLGMTIIERALFDI